MKRIFERNVVEEKVPESLWLRVAGGIVDHLTLLAMWAYAVWPMAILIALLYVLSRWLNDEALFAVMLVGGVGVMWRYATTLNRLQYTSAGDQWFAMGRRLFGLAPRNVNKRPPPLGE
jgi:hypothetical protein